VAPPKPEGSSGSEAIVLHLRTPGQIELQELSLFLGPSLLHPWQLDWHLIG